ncbi:hypothetical protein [Gracilibacillus sp. YIM 98692]|nr:hypothetical protein [Gracilibacillus sp. YIM 98692]
MNDSLKRYAQIRGDDQVQSLQLEGKIAAQIKTVRQSLKLSQ